MHQCRKVIVEAWFLIQQIVTPTQPFKGDDIKLKVINNTSRKIRLMINLSACNNVTA